MKMNEAVNDHDEVSELGFVIEDEALVERIEQLAWEKDMELMDLVIACCWYGLRHHEKALTSR